MIVTRKRVRKEAVFALQDLFESDTERLDSSSDEEVAPPKKKTPVAVLSQVSPLSESNDDDFTVPVY